MRHQSFLDVSQSVDIHTFEKRLVEFAQGLGFGIVAAALVVDRPVPGRHPAFVAIGNMPEGFAESSRSVEDSMRDPVLKRLKRMSIPFVYDQELYVADGAGDLWEQQAVFGYRTGISVALHLPGHKHFLLGVDRDEPLPKDDEKLTRVFANLQLLAVHAQDAAVRLLGSDGELPRDPKLTAREVEVLKWTMDGKSAWSAGQILSVSEHTVNFHLRNILRKLDSSSKHQAVLKAIALGIL
jgi:DNA-binding CsgD family transcriptional regulator